MEKKFLDLQEAAEFLMLSRSALYKKAQCRDVSHFKIGKKLFFRPEDLENFLQKNFRPAV